ncbi:hypothetical protein MNEG_0195 [Monoraphidium neglectum]|uniref:Fibronectin type-III domain-containing protein n=1 Tax=Monoraphidium neglectum TaxID=145388 RepID=A0A0D2MZB3_9CHLO|nr:hypothetical protein MNEG_0195 [Monoraphidium neglectum]KIZ07750.1 hypothetical protein MNEG_0195 [Monoraphidium neglectum]|eukprot:XP_013906769.1 hypothetical protein MNEG_0195 [Monoraphidium neglectum]
MASSKSFQNAFKTNRGSACSNKQGSLCAAKASVDETAALTVAASPTKFDARSSSDTGGFVLTSPVGDQGSCYSCTAFAVAGAAEAAVSAALRKTAVGRNWSVQDLHFCLATNSGESKSCRSSASSLIDVLKPFTAATRALVLDKCLPYEAPDAPLDQDLCDYKCKDTDPDAVGKFEYVQLNSPWEVQEHLRNWGGVVTRLDIYDDLRPFFAKNPKGSYNGPAPNATFIEGHAVLLVGYDNTRNAYLIKNSWGTDFGDGGFAWISYAAGEKVGIGARADTYGLRFRPANPPPLPFVYTTAALTDCLNLTVPDGMWPSTVAQLLRVPLRKLLIDNLETITDLEKPLDPKKPLIACGVPQAIVTRLMPVGGRPAAASASPAAGLSPPATPAPAPKGDAAAAAAADAAAGEDCQANEPEPIRNLRLVSASTDGNIKLTWDPPSGPECINFYDIQVMDIASGKITKAKITGLNPTSKVAGSFTFKGSPGQQYQFTVSAINEAGGSAERSITLGGAAGARRLRQHRRSLLAARQRAFGFRRRQGPLAAAK